MVQPIGGSGDGENAWHIKVDNNGGLYVLATLYNNSYAGDPNAVPMHFDDTHTQPLYTYYDQTIEPAHKSGFSVKIQYFGRHTGMEQIFTGRC